MTYDSYDLPYTWKLTWCIIFCRFCGMWPTKLTYSTAQRQLDTRMHAAAWNFLCEDYIMHSIFERTPVTFVPASGKLSGMCARECSTHFELTFLMKLIINCIYMMNLRTLSPYVSIDFWINSPTKTTHVQPRAVSHSLLFGVLSFHAENGSFITDWISIKLFVFGMTFGWKPVRKYASY